MEIGKKYIKLGQYCKYEITKKWYILIKLIFLVQPKIPNCPQKALQSVHI